MTALSACRPPAEPTVIDYTSPDAQMGVTDASKPVFDRLESLALPAEWKRQAVNYGIMTFVTDEYERDQEPFVDHDTFMVDPLELTTCSMDYALVSAETNWGPDVPAHGMPKEVVLKGKNIGYTWPAFGGVAGGALPNMRHWCVHVPEAGYDLLVSAYEADAKTKAFVEQTFLPLWWEEGQI